jgi:hypothetical protein
MSLKKLSNEGGHYGAKRPASYFQRRHRCRGNMAKIR